MHPFCTRILVVKQKKKKTNFKSEATDMSFELGRNSIIKFYLGIRLIAILNRTSHGYITSLLVSVVTVRAAQVHGLLRTS